MARTQAFLRIALMEEVNVITHEQKLLLDEFRNDSYLSSSFYFTGGTALSLYYLQHRESVDLDFFTTEPFDPQTILKHVKAWENKLNLAIEYIRREDTHIFNLTFPNKQVVKVDFGLYPYKRVHTSKTINSITVDSAMDIAINKLLTVQQRAEVKDFVDLYFLLREFSIWDLIVGVKVKFGVKLDPFIVGTDFLKVEKFDFLPTMIKPLNLEELKSFFITQAKEIGGKFVR